MSGQLVKLQVAIANGAALSGEVDLSQYEVVGIQMPSAWTAAALTFQGRGHNDVLADETIPALADVYDDGGTELSVSAAASRYIAIVGSKRDALASLRYMKVRSGTTGTPVNQGAARRLLLILKPRGV